MSFPKFDEKEPVKKHPKPVYPVIDGYELTQDWGTKGAGTSRWAFAMKDGREYFIKEFPSPIFPTSPDLPEAVIERKRNLCYRFYATKKRLYDEIAKCGDKNIIGMKDFFPYNAKYYLVTEKVKDSGVSMKEISELPEETKLRLLLKLASSMERLQERKIVHADIKPSNIMLQKDKRGELIPKIIDFDAGYLEGLQPPADKMGGDFAYLAPETCQYMCGEEVQLTTKVDVFATGIIFHQYMTGVAPEFEIIEQVDDAGNKQETAEPKLSDQLTSAMKQLIGGMLLSDAKRRTSMSDVVKKLQGILEPPLPLKPKPEDGPESAGTPTRSAVSGQLVSTFGRKKKKPNVEFYKAK